MQPENPYLAGNFAPVDEEVTVADLEVTGRIPTELAGRYVRNGPNPVTRPEPASYHWFTGDGMVHGIRLDDGAARWYRNRWVRSASVAKALGEPPRPGPVHANMDFAPNTNVIGHAGRTFAIVEAGARPYELTYDLDTLGPCDFDGTLPGGYTAHPKRDPATGELHAISYFWGWGNRVQYTVLDRGGRITRVVDVPTTGQACIHDMSLTERYAVIYDLPVVFSMEAAQSGAAFPYRWKPDYPARVGLLPRNGGADDVRWFHVEPCYVFHPLNAFDEGARVVLDVIRHPKMFANHTDGPDEGTPTLERWTLDPASNSVKEERLDDRGQEFPRVDERVVGRNHRYGYTVGAASEHDPRRASHQGCVIKHDFAHHSAEVRYLGRAAEAGEPIFIPRSTDAAEDDGWVLTLVYDPTRHASDLLILNAADFRGEPQAVVHLPRRVPFGFHGNWLPDQA
ncbi:MAG TPA: carotenoid oxygenase family protein [Gammaproteobacteria bacterium]|nr:carotenoid oxygenase family protein [Gammaproteobacteria bacterium]